MTETEQSNAETFAAATVIPTNRLGDPAAQGWAPGIDEQSALSLPPYWSGVRFLSETLGTLPASVLRKSGSGRDKDPDHPVHYLLAEEPSELATPSTFWSTLFGHVINYGNAYALIERDDKGVPTALYNLVPDRVEPLRVEGRNWYAVRTNEGATPVPGRDVVHVAGWGFDGVRGYAPIKLMAESLKLGRSAQRWATKFYDSGAHLGGVVRVEQKLTPEQLADVRREINQRHSGLDNAGKWMVLMGGADVTPLGAPPETAKLVEVLNLSVQQVAQLLRVPPIHLYDYGRATWGNAVEMDRHTVQYSLRPWIVRAEQELRRKLFTRAERRDGYYVNFSVDALLRGAHKERLEGWRLGLSEGIYTINEVRRWEDLPAVGPEGDLLRIPANSIPAIRLAAPVSTGDERAADPGEDQD